jgi:adenylate kinase
LSLQILILGPQGSGKGTQAKRIASEYGVAHIATGDMFRSAIARRTPVGVEVEPILARGDLVPDTLTIGLIRERLAEPDAQAGFILDGFPRTIAQAEALDALLDELGRGLSVVFELRVSDEICVERLLARARAEGRNDDTPEVIARRIELYHQETAPLIDHYQPSGKVVVIHGDRSIEEVWGEIQTSLEQVAA